MISLSVHAPLVLVGGLAPDGRSPSRSSRCRSTAASRECVRPTQVSRTGASTTSRLLSFSSREASAGAPYRIRRAGDCRLDGGVSSVTAWRATSLGRTHRLPRIPVRSEDAPDPVVAHGAQQPCQNDAQGNREYACRIGGDDERNGDPEHERERHGEEQHAEVYVHAPMSGFESSVSPDPRSRDAGGPTRLPRRWRTRSPRHKPHRRVHTRHLSSRDLRLPEFVTPRAPAPSWRTRPLKRG